MRRKAFEAVPWTSEEWRAMNAQFEIKTGRAWPNLEPSERAPNTREYVLREFWQTFVDRLVLGFATHTNKVHAVAVMDKIEGWEEEEKWWVPESQHACGSAQRSRFVTDKKTS